MYFELYQGGNKQWYWRLKSGNHQIVATGGEGYVNKQDALHGIDLVRGTSSETPVREST